MGTVTINPKDQLVMSLVHYFVTKENYAPIMVQGVKDEIWLENLEGPYRVIRINSNYIHNKEQYDFDIFKMKSILNQIKKKTLSLKINALNICVNAGDYVEYPFVKGIDTVHPKNITEIKEDKELNKAFPKLKSGLIRAHDSLELVVNASSEINKKTEKENKLFEDIFKSKKIIFTSIIIAICVLMFLLTYILGNSSTDNYTLLYFGANYGPLVKEGQVWRLLTCAFLHAGVVHLLLNMYSLYIIGSQVENFIGKWKFLGIYLISAISGSLMSIIFGDYLAVGASGAIFGLLGALLYFGYHYRLYLGDVLIKQIVPIILLNLFLGFMITGVDNACHIGGLIGGFLATIAFGLKGKSEKKERINGLISLSIYLLFLGYMVFIY